MEKKNQKIQPYKVDAVKQIKGMIEEAKDLIFTDYRGLNVGQMTDLRQRLRKQETEYRVIRNNFAQIAVSQLGLPFQKEFLIDPTALVMVKQDPGPVAKILVDFAKDSTLRVKGALIEGRVMGEAEVIALSKLPSRDELYARLMGSITAPITNLLYALNGVVTKLVRTLQAVADTKRKQ